MTNKAMVSCDNVRHNASGSSKVMELTVKLATSSLPLLSQNLKEFKVPAYCIILVGTIAVVVYGATHLLRHRRKNK